MLDRLATHWQSGISNSSTRTRVVAVGALILALVVVISVLGRTGAASQTGSGGHDSGLAACTSLSGTRRLGAANDQETRAEFASSRWPDLSAAGTAYVDAIGQLHANREVPGADIARLLDRLVAACARHGRPLTYR
jgi:hypothetical protein